MYMLDCATICYLVLYVLIFFTQRGASLVGATTVHPFVRCVSLDQKGPHEDTMASDMGAPPSLERF